MATEMRLQRQLEHNKRLREQYELERISVSQASTMYVSVVCLVCLVTVLSVTVLETFYNTAHIPAENELLWVEGIRH